MIKYIALLFLVACSRDVEFYQKPQPQPPTPVADVVDPVQCPPGSYVDHFAHVCKHGRGGIPRYAEPTPVEEHHESSGPRIGISSRGRLGINSNKGLGLHIDHRGRIGLGWGF